MTATGISIPSIGLNHSVSLYSVAGGVLNPPSGMIAQVSGYGRVTPGRPGIGVLAGHVTYNGPDVFYRLPSIAPGATITVRYSDGTSKNFVVSRKASVNKDRLTSDPSVWGGSASPSLVLVTCDSSSGWANAYHHVNNYVVWATPTS